MVFVSLVTHEVTLSSNMISTAFLNYVASSQKRVKQYCFILLLLLLFVGLVSPKYLVDAFNPATTNILGLGLGLGFCYLIWFVHENEQV